MLAGYVQHPIADVAGHIKGHTFVLDGEVAVLRRVGEPRFDLGVAPKDSDLGLGHNAEGGVVGPFQNLAGGFANLDHVLDNICSHTGL